MSLDLILLRPKNCAVRQYTADGVPVGRCWYYVGEDNVCPIHGDVAEIQKRLAETGKLTDERTLRKAEVSKLPRVTDLEAEVLSAVVREEDPWAGQRGVGSRIRSQALSRLQSKGLLKRGSGRAYVATELGKQVHEKLFGKWWVKR